jgi:hypothetical protein
LLWGEPGSAVGFFGGGPLGFGFLGSFDSLILWFLVLILVFGFWFLV